MAKGSSLRVEVIEPFHAVGRDVVPGETVDMPLVKALWQIEWGHARPVLPSAVVRPALPSEGCGLREAYLFHVIEYLPSDGKMPGELPAGTYNGSISFYMYRHPPLWRLAKAGNREIFAECYARSEQWYFCELAMYSLVRRLVNGDLELRGVAENDLAIGQRTKIPQLLFDSDLKLMFGRSGELWERQGRGSETRLFSALLVAPALAREGVGKDRPEDIIKAESYLRELIVESPDEKPFQRQDEFRKELARKFNLTDSVVRRLMEEIPAAWRTRPGRNRKAAIS